MAKIERTINHNLGLDGAKNVVAVLAKKLQDSFGSFVKDVQWSDDKTSATVKGSGFDGNFKVSDKDVKLEMNLGLLTSAFKGKIESEIDKYTTPDQIEKFAKENSAKA